MLIAGLACGKTHADTAWETLHADRVILGNSKFPLAVESTKVGTYDGLTKSGGGYFYDDVLEYRVWYHPERGGDDDFYSFAQYERAAEYSNKTRGAEPPLVLVRQREWIAEPKPHEFHAERGERLAEWQMKWLEGHKRGPNSIQKFLKHPVPAGPNE